jgi:hypothetical protein
VATRVGVGGEIGKCSGEAQARKQGPAGHPGNLSQAVVAGLALLGCHGDEYPGALWGYTEAQLCVTCESMDPY